MSRNSVVLEKAASEASLPLHAAQTPIEATARSGEYLDLIRRLFHHPSVVAVVSSGSGGSAAGVSEEIAAELAASGTRVVVVPVANLLRMNPIAVPDRTAFMPGSARNVWLWPSPLGQQIEFFKSRGPADPDSWLDCLRRNFDSVLLDCSAGEVTPGIADIAAMADAVVLVAEAGRTTRQQIQRDQRALQLRDAKLAGCILLRRR
jgi:Mrp family chromosome partitioning ATPase